MISRPINFDVDKLTRVGGVSAIPVLLEALNGIIASKPRKTIYHALAALLPQLKASDANLLTTGHRYFLNHVLKCEVRRGSKRNFGQQVPVEFMLAILKSYEQVGDATAVPIVEMLANEKVRGFRQIRIQEAAKACLPLLQANNGAIGHAQTLLRAASKTDTAPDMLLRPASETAATYDPDLLLRATHSADTPTP